MRGTQNSQNNLEKEKAGHYRTTIELLDTIELKTGWYCHKDTHIEQQKRMKSPEINSSVYAQLISNKRAQKRWGKG